MELLYNYKVSVITICMELKYLYNTKQIQMLEDKQKSELINQWFVKKLYTLRSNVILYIIRNPSDDYFKCLFLILLYVNYQNNLYLV